MKSSLSEWTRAARCGALIFFTTGVFCTATTAEPANGPEAPEAEVSGSAADLIRELRREIEDLRRQLASLSARVDAMGPPGAPGGAGGAGTGSATSIPDSPDSGLALLRPPSDAPMPSAPPVVQAAPQSRTIFNPGIGVVFQAIGSNSVNHDLEEDGFSLSEAEISFQAAVDPYARVDLFVAVNSEGEAEVEEGYVSTLALPGGLKVRGGRFKNAFGKWNTLHDHQFYAVESPGSLQNFFGEESLTTDGGSLSWLLPGTGATWVESITEIGSTGNDVSFNGESRDMILLEHIGVVFPATAGATLGAGISGAFGKAGPTDVLLDAIETAGLSGSVVPDESLASNLFGVDVTWKWKPARSGRYRSAMFQTEAFAGNRRAETLDPAGRLRRETIRSTGGYAYGEYQFARRFRGGLLYDATRHPHDDDARERAISAVVRITPTEFQEFRLQFRHVGRNKAMASRFDGVDNDNVILVEWIPVMGAHPAHKY